MNTQTRSTLRQNQAPALSESLRGSIAASVGKYARQTSILPDRALITREVAR